MSPSPLSSSSPISSPSSLSSSPTVEGGRLERRIWRRMEKSMAEMAAEHGWLSIAGGHGQRARGKKLNWTFSRRQHLHFSPISLASSLPCALPPPARSTPPLHRLAASSHAAQTLILSHHPIVQDLLAANAPPPPRRAVFSPLRDAKSPPGSPPTKRLRGGRRGE